MSDTDSFIDEVTEEVRRDRLFRTFRRWAPLAVALVVLLVAAAAWNEWRKARDVAAAEARGDLVLTALDAEDGAARAGALRALEIDGPAQAFVTLLAASEESDAGQRAEALSALAVQEDVAPRYRHLAQLKLALLDADGAEGDPEARIALLEPLSGASAPYRLLALEQIALARVALGESEAAVAGFRDILADNAAGQGLRQRAAQMIVALGAEVEPS